MNFSFTSSSWFLFVLATPSVIAKKEKKTKHTKNKNSIKSVVPTFVPIDNNKDSNNTNNLGSTFGGSNLNCDPMGDYNDKEFGCKIASCASDKWLDGCSACMCFNNGNASWCDARQSVYYDVYFDRHGENPFGDSNKSNRKCNTIFSPKEVFCQWDWECEFGLVCRALTTAHRDYDLCHNVQYSDNDGCCLPLRVP